MRNLFALLVVALLGACMSPSTPAPSHRSDGSKVCGGVDGAGRPLPGTGFICHPPGRGGNTSSGHRTANDPGYDRIAGAIDKMAGSVDKLTGVVIKLDERVTTLETGRRPVVNTSTGSGSPQPVATYSAPAATTADSMAATYEAARKGNGSVGGMPFEEFATKLGYADTADVSKTLFGQAAQACNTSLLNRLGDLETARRNPAGEWVWVSSPAPTTCALLGRVYKLGNYLVTPTWRVLKLN